MSEEEKRMLATKEASNGDGIRDEEPTKDAHRLTQPRTPPWRRLALIAFVLLLFWLAWAVRKHVCRPKIIYADRYSDVYKYRPAASPIITEILKDGRTRLRGAEPTQR